MFNVLIDNIIMEEFNPKTVENTVNNKLNKLIELSKITNYYSISSVHKIAREISMLEEYMGSILFEMKLQK